jgi:hypothetical protein
MAEIAYVFKLPPCDFCKERGVDKPADYDAMTKQGPWANMCTEDYVENAKFADLGTGKGQRFIVGDPPPVTDEQRRATARAAAESGDLDAFFEAVGDEDPADFL